MTTVAGTGAPGFGGDSGAAGSAVLDTPMGVVVDSAGNIYIADTANQRIREISTSGTITTIAGNGEQGYSGDGGAATSGRLNTPTAVAVDSSGHLFIADSGNNVVREVSGGTMTTVAGNGTAGYSGDSGAAASAELDTPEGVAVDASGNLYIADTANQVIRKVSGGTITTVAGDHVQGYSGDSGAATSAELNTPVAVAVDGGGTLYIADTGNHVVRKVSGGTMTTIAGDGTPGDSGDGGAATSAELDTPMGLALDASGTLYIADTANDVIRRVLSGTISTIAGDGGEGWSGDNGAAVLAELDTPVGLALDASGNLLIADQQNSLVRKWRAASLDFGSAVQGHSSASQTITVANNGPGSLSITSAQLTTGTEFALASGGTCGAVFPVSVASSSNCTFVLTMKPGGLGTRTDKFTLTDSAASSPQIVSLTGTGTGIPAATLSGTSLSFGNQRVGQASSAQSITITNSGTVPLHFSAINASGDYALDGSSTCSTSTAVAVSASCTVAVTFTPSATGSRSGSVTLTDDAPDSPQAVTLSGTGIEPAVSLSGSTLSYGNQLVGQKSAAQSITITNNGTAPLHFSAINASGDYALDATTTCSTSTAVAASTTCTVAVTFTPSATGSRTGAVTLTDDAPTTPQAVILSGTGIQPAATLSGTTLSYGNQLVGQSSGVQSITVTNSGTAPLHISAIAATGDYALNGATTCSTSTAVAASTSCTVAVTLTPTTTGSRSGAVTLTDDAPTSPQGVVLSGTGIQPAASLSGTTLSYGNQLVGQSSGVQSITITNSGTAPLHFSAINASGDYALAGTTTCSTSTAVAASASCTVAVTFTPTATGSRNGSITLTDDAPASPQAVILSGTGIQPAISFSAASLNFGNQLLHQTSAVQTITITNSGTAPLHLTGITASGDYSLDGATTCSTGTAVAANATCTIAVTFTPTASGSRSGAVTVTDDAPSSPQTVALSGSGVQPAVQLSSTSLVFPQTVLGQSSARQTITVTNAGTGDLSISGVAVTGDFHIDSGATTCSVSQTIAAGSSCTVAVLFGPTATGSRTGTLTITDTAPGSPHQVALSGTGTQPGMVVSPASLTFSSTEVGAKSAGQTISVTNSGTAALHLSQIAFSGDFTLDAASTCSTSTAVVAGASCVLAVDFAPTAAGARSGSLSLSTDAPGSPASVRLTGTAVQPQLTLQPASLSFGSQMVGTASTAQTVTLSNTGTAPLPITGVAVTGDFSLVSGCGSSLPAGASCSLSLSFTPIVAGPRSGALTLTDSAGVQTVALSGDGATPGVSVNPSVVNFGSQAIGVVSQPVAITLSNTGRVPLTLTGIVASGDFSVTSNCGTSLAAGSSCVLQAVFTPAAAGSRAGSITVSDNAGTQTVALSGTGSAPGLSLNPARLTFAGQQVGGTSPAQTVTVANTGTAVLNLFGVAVTGDFSVSSDCGASLAPGASCSLSIAFTPSATGDRTGTVTISSGLGSEPIVVSGSGNAPAVLLTPAALDFGSVTVGAASISQPMTLTNSGTAALSVSSIQVNGDFSETNRCPANLAPGGSCSLDVVFSPSQTGTRSGTVTVADAAGTQSAAVSGNGLAPATPVLASSPAGLTFGSQDVGSASSPQMVTVTNSGAVPFAISGITVNGDFRQTNTCPSTLAAGDHCAVEVVFTPAGAGTRAGSLAIASAGGTSQYIGLVGIGNPAALTLSPASVSFGSLPVGTVSAAQTVIVSNSGGAPLQITSISTGGNFSETDDCAAALAPGESCRVNVSFSPAAAGSRTGSIVVTSNIGPAAVGVSGVGTVTEARLTPIALNFGSVAVGSTSATQTVTLTNPGTAPLTMGPVSIDGDFSQQNDCAASLDAGSSCVVNVALKPTASGARTGTLLVEDAAGVQVVALNGTGIAPGIAFSPTSLFFGSQPVGTASAAQTVTVSNTGNAPLQIAGIVPIGDFGETSTCAAELVPGARCTINVALTPGGVGTRTGNLLLVDNAGGGAQFISLNGSGVPAGVLLSPSSLTFGSEPVGLTSPAQTVTLTNRTGSALAVIGISATGEMNVTNTCGSLIPDGGSCTLSVSVTPALDGAITGQIVLNLVSQTGAVANSGVRGGFSAHAIRRSASAAPAPFDGLVAVTARGAIAGMTLSPSTVDFGSQTVGSTSAATSVVITNSSAQTVNLGGVSVTGAFTQSSTCGASLASGGNCTVQVAFAPTTAGAQTGTLSVSDDLGTQAVALSGNGLNAGLSVTPSRLFFPDTPVGGSSSAQSVTIGNHTGAAYALSGITVTGDFSASANTCGASLADGGSCTVSVVFTPTVQGAGTGSLTLAGASPIVVALSGNGTAPPVSLTPPLVSFASTALGSSSTAQTITVSNHGSQAVTLSGVTAAGDFAATSTCGASLAGGASCAIQAVFTPKDLGLRRGSVSLTVGSTVLQSQLQGTGSGSALRLSTTRLDFGSGLIGAASQPQAVTLTNLANTPLALTGVKASGDYAVTSGCGASLAGQASCTLDVSFTPTALGDRSGSLMLTDSASDSPQTIALDGTGQQLSFTATPADSATIVVSGTAQYGLSLRATGYRGMVRFSCDGAPDGTHCVVTPWSVNVQDDQPVPVTVTVATYPTRNAALPPVAPSGPPSQRWLLPGLLVTLLLTWLLLGFGGRRRPLVLMAMFALLALTLAGCGGGPGVVNGQRPGTAVGQYKLTITATTADGVSRSTQLTLNVQ